MKRPVDCRRLGLRDSSETIAAATTTTTTTTCRTVKGTGTGNRPRTGTGTGTGNTANIDVSRSVDTLDCPPPPALPPRRPPWPPNNLSAATLRSLSLAGNNLAGSATRSVVLPSSNPGSSSSSSSSRSSSSEQPFLNIINQQSINRKSSTANQIQQLTPPKYQAPPRPPSRNGGDEGRVARTGSGRFGGSSRGVSGVGVGLSTNRGCPGGARAVRVCGTSALASSRSSPSGGGTPSPPPSVFRPIGVSGTATSTTSCNEQWARTAVTSAVQGRRTTTNPSVTSNSQRTTTPTDIGGWLPERQLELRTGLSPMSRPPSANSSASSSPSSPAPTLARVHGHDHNRPLPPPRLTEPSSQGPLTAPLTPLAGQTGILRTSSRAPAPVPIVHEVTRVQATSLTESEPSPSPAGRGSQLGEVTLTVPRPDGERAVNEYVETPFRPGCNLTAPQKCLKSSNDRAKHHRHHINQHRGRTNNSQNPRLLQSGNPAAGVKGGITPVTKQPVSFTKEPTNSIGGSPGSLGQQIQSQQQQQQFQQQQQIQQLQQRSSLFPGIGTPGVGSIDEGLSIMCEYCGKCRCESCREPAPLPSRWLCDNSCFCSAETALDYASCLCCVKGLFYHCGDGGSGVEAETEGAGSCADEPCSCAGSRRLARWTCLGALTLALPCLLCYWPLRGCVAMCEACYARYASHGCRCDPTANAGRHLTASNLRDSRDPEKRLLDPVTPEL